MFILKARRHLLMIIRLRSIKVTTETTQADRPDPISDV